MEQIKIKDSFIVQEEYPAPINNKLKCKTFFQLTVGNFIHLNHSAANPQLFAAQNAVALQVENAGDEKQENIFEVTEIKDSFKTIDTVFIQEVLSIAPFFVLNGDAYAHLKEHIKITDNFLLHKTDRPNVDEKVIIKDFFKISTQESVFVLESLLLSDFYQAEGGQDVGALTYCVNGENETTRYENYNFANFACFKGMHLALKADGLYDLKGNDDEGEPIAAMVNFGKQSLGTLHFKRVPYVYAGLKSDGEMQLCVRYEQEDYQYQARKTDEYLATVRFDLGRGVKGNYLNFEIMNVDGADFDLREVCLYCIELQRRI